MDSSTSRAPRWAALIFTAAVHTGLSACTGFSQDGGFASVAAATQSQLNKEVYWPRSAAETDKNAAAVARLLMRPLGPEDAVQIALLNNRDLRASFEDLKISEADLVQAGRLANPRFDFAHASADGQFDVVETLSFNVLSLLEIPYARAIEKRRFAETQTAVFLGVAHLAAQTREAYFDAVAAHQSLEYRSQVSAAAATGSVLAQRMLAAGNWNSIDQAREQVFYLEATRAQARAQLADLAAREKLESLLGLSDASPSATPLALATTLPDLPASIDELPDIERIVLENRVDLKMMRENIDALAHRLKLVRATRFVNVLDLGPTWVKQGPSNAPHEAGYAITLEVPIFDDGGARLQKSEALYVQAVERFAQAALDARSQVRQAYAAYKSSYELAKQQRDVVLPLRKSVSEQNLLRYNASLISIFELLADAREQVSSVDDYITDLRDFWRAKSRLDAALLGSSTP
jgi:outer membrane protein TolC